jgi:catechol 2,3-dioxygenase-like lactoylglutathione lyase family enzyme
MVTFAGIDHVSFTVTDLDISEAFYCEVLDFVVVMDVGYGRICMHPTTGFILALVKHPEAHGGSFTELHTGLDHLGLGAESRAELEEWERRLDRQGVAYTPIRDMEMGHHLNFRDPDGIALELTAAKDLLKEARRLMASQEPDQDDIAAFVSENVRPDLAPRSRAADGSDAAPRVRSG